MIRLLLALIAETAALGLFIAAIALGALAIGA